MLGGMSPQRAVFLALLCLACGSEPEPRHSDPDGAMRECSASMEHIADDPSGPMTTAAIRACAGLFVEESCRAAVSDTTAGDDGDGRAAAMARACAPAYCPSLEAPRPYLCEADVEEMDNPQLAAAWPSLRERALMRDLGPSRGGRAAIALAALDRLTEPVTLSIPMELPGTASPAPPGPPLTVTMTAAPDGFTLTVEGEPDASRTFARAAPASEITSWLPHAEGEAASAVIAADLSVGHGDFIRLVDALRAAGYTHYAIDVEPAAPAE